MTDITRREFVSTSLMAAMFGVRGWARPKGELLGIVPFVDAVAKPGSRAASASVQRLSPLSSGLIGA